ncbi:MAG: ROK family protein [Bryobacteraceae bacterium]
MRTLAIDIGGTKLTAALFADQVLIERRSCATDRSGGPAWMLDQIERTAALWLADERVDGCGIGFGGPVDFAAQRVVCSTHVEGWRDFDIVGAVRQRLGVPAVVDRDTMAGALGEGFHGAGVGSRPMFYVTLSTGIGGGLLLDSGLFHGADSFSCEIGHHTVQPDGPECLCGARGCFERLCSGLWLERDYGKPAYELLDDPGFVRRYVKPLAQGLKTCIMLINPARIVIGGGIGKAGPKLFGPLREELARQITPWSKARVDVVPAALGDDSVLWGALVLAQTCLYQ